MDLIPLKRSSYDIGLFGKKGSGKTIILSLLGAMQKKVNDAVIISNYHLNYEHIFCDNIIDLNKIYDLPKGKKKIFLGDDFERWFNSRLSKTKLNMELNDILVDWGKINCSLYVSSKRTMIVDIGLRESLSEFWFPQLELQYKTQNQQINEKMKEYLNFLKIRIVRYDDEINKLPEIEFRDLHKYRDLYETTEIVKKIRI